jgi:phage tail sheath protein FI
MKLFYISTVRAIAFLLFLLFFSLSLKAQKKVRLEKDTVKHIETLPNVRRSVPAVKQPTLMADIEQRLNLIMDKYVTSPNTSTTWIQIKNETDNLLLSYFRAGKLLGTKPEQAYFTKIGQDNMTSADIANGKMILLVGIATIRPAEFNLLKIERMTTVK